jgi:hypothetical protein
VRVLVSCVLVYLLDWLIVLLAYICLASVHYSLSLIAVARHSNHTLTRFCSNLPYQQLANSPGGFQPNNPATLNGLGSPPYNGGAMSPGAGRGNQNGMNGNGAPGMGGSYDNAAFQHQLPS